MASAKASGRSVSGIDLGAPIQRLAAEGLLIKGGGHKMAAGLTVAEDKLDAAMARLSELLAKQGAHLAGAADLKLERHVDARRRDGGTGAASGTGRPLRGRCPCPAICLCRHADPLCQAGG